MNKKGLLFICAVLLSTLLCSCSSETAISTPHDTQYDTPFYTLTRKDGQYNLTSKITPPDGSCCSVLFYPEFQSVEEMRQGILTGSFEEYEIHELLRASMRSDNGLDIWNLDHLYDFTAPDEFSLEKIRWCGNYYDCDLTSDTAWGGIYCYGEEDYTEKLDHGYKDFLTNPNFTVTDQRKTPNRFATVYYGHTDVAKFKYICYELRSGDKKMYIQEEYTLEFKTHPEEGSSSVPDTIYLWGEENDGYFYGVFFDFAERPTTKWLLQFGIKPHMDIHTN